MLNSKLFIKSVILDHSSLLQNLLISRKTDDVIRLIELIRIEYGDRINKAPVGGRENNLGQMARGSDPGKGIVERLTNATNVVLELEHKRTGIPKCKSPYEATTSWLQICYGWNYFSKMARHTPPGLRSICSLTRFL